MSNKIIKYLNNRIYKSKIDANNKFIKYMMNKFKIRYIIMTIKNKLIKLKEKNTQKIGIKTQNQKKQTHISNHILNILK